MARNGSGLAVRAVPDFVAATIISETDMNTLQNDVIDMLTQSISKDGQTPLTGSLIMSGNKLTGLGAGTASGDSLSLGQAQAEAMVWTGLATGAADALVLTPTPSITAYAAGQRFVFIASNSPNTGATTVDINSLGVKDIQNNGSALVANDIVADKIYQLIYSGTAFQILRISLDELANDQSPELSAPLIPNANYIGSGKGADIASASPLVIGVDGDFSDVTGTTGFSVMTVAANRSFTLQFDDVLTIVVGGGITLNNGGANYTTAAGDIIKCQSTAENVVTGVVTKANGTALVSSGGVWVLIGTVEADTDASLTITGLNDTHDMYAIVITNMKCSTNGTLLLRVGDSGGVDSGASDYIYHSSQVSSAGSGYDANFSTGDSSITIGSIGPGNDAGLSCMLYMNRSSDNTTDPFITGTYASDATGGTVLTGGTISGRRVALIDLDRVQLLFNTGNIVAGRFSIYGISHE